MSCYVHANTKSLDELPLQHLIVGSLQASTRTRKTIHRAGRGNGALSNAVRLLRATFMVRHNSIPHDSNALSSMNPVTPTSSGAKPTGSAQSAQGTEKCYYDKKGDYVCKDVVEQQRAEPNFLAQGVRSDPASAGSSSPKSLNAETQEKPENLKELDNDRLVRRRDALQISIRDVTEQINYLRDIRMYLPQLAVAKARQNLVEQVELEKIIAQSEAMAGLAPGEAQRPDKLTNLAGLKQIDLRRQTQELDSIDAEISHRLNIEARAQDFKKLMSGLFAGIVALVIIGFFVVALHDPKVGRDIFAGQEGIRFITLFSLVIAIILFGITGVLEGKELAALLGGLAGYILGRAGTATASEGEKTGPKVETLPAEQAKKEELAQRQAA